MNYTGLWRQIGTVACIAAALTISSTSFAQNSDFNWPRVVVVGTTSTSGGGFASTNGWAPYLQEQIGSPVRIVPEGSELLRYRRLNIDKNIHLSLNSAAEVRYQIEGYGGMAAAMPAAQRIVWHHSDMPWGYVVAGDSELETMDDLKKGGVRVAKGVWSPGMVETTTKALPAYLGLSEEEAEKTLKYVPVSSYPENCRSVVEGKADVAYCTPVSSVLAEMEGAPGGIRWLPMEPDNEGWSGYLKHRPMLVPSEISLGVSSARGVAGATSHFIYMGSADMEVDFAYNLAKWFHESYDDYKDSHFLSQRMSLKQFRSYLDRTPLPVHEGTVKYLREIDAWSEEDDAWNKQAIARMNRWIEARKAAMAEAQENRIKISADNSEYLDILAKHTKGLEIFRSRL